MDKKPRVDLVEEARQLRAALEERTRQAEELERRIRMARGTARMRKPTVNLIVKNARGPHWVGDDGTTPELMEAIRHLISDRPHTFQEILEATGARDNRVKGAITALQRAGHRVVDLAPEGTRAARWFIPSDEIMKRIERAKRATEKR